MSLARYIDIHTHRTPQMADEEVFRLCNKQNNFDQLAPGAFYSLGLHPWYLEHLAEQWDALKRNAQSQAVWAIGECGLDALCNTPADLQQKAFQLQIELANTLKKPLLIHCVRAYPAVLSLLQQAKVPVIFHGFHKKISLANQLIAAGYYLSFGAALVAPNATRLQEVFAAVPAHKIFLETDDAVIDIHDIYKVAAKIRKTEEEVIILQLQENFKKVFNL